MTFELKKNSIEAFTKHFSAENRTDITIYPVSFKPFAYRQMLTICVGTGNVTMGVGFNSYSADDKLRSFIEFNPNKCFPEWKNEFLDLCELISKLEATRMDIAIDIPIDIRATALIKDQRIYECRQKSAEDITEYLGSRNTVGRVKLYNKTKEAGLSYALTRLEITTEPNIASFKKHIPQLIISEEEQIDLEHADTSKLTEKDKVIVAMLNEHELHTRANYLQKFPYRYRKKIEPYTLTDNRFQINIPCVEQVIEMVNSLCRLAP